MWSYIVLVAAGVAAARAGDGAEAPLYSASEMSWGGPAAGCAGGAAPGGRQVQCALPAGRVTLMAGAAALSLACEDSGFSCAELHAARHLLSPQPAVLRSLSVRGCALGPLGPPGPPGSPGPLGPEPLACVLALVNATGAVRVSVTDARTPLRIEHVRGLRAVRTLRVSFVDKTAMSVPYDALAELPELESFALLMATVTLEAGGTDAGATLPRLVRLELAGGLLRSVPAAAFARTPALQHLLLWGNNMTHIDADALRGLPRLQTLSLNSNALTSLPGALLRPTRALRTLHAYANALTELPADLLAGLDQLEELKIFNNNATLVVANDALAALPALRRVTLESSGVSRLLTNTLGDSPLRQLSLARNRLAALPVALFRQQRALESLDLSYNTLASLPRGLLAPLANLTVLTLRSNNLTHLDSDCFSGLASLRELDLSANMLANLRADTFDPLQQLQVLSVAHNSLRLGAGGGYGYTHSDVTALPDDVTAGPWSPFRNLVRLRRLTLAHNRIAAVAGDWRLLTHLQTLDLAYNSIQEITDVDMEFLSNCTVDLRHNNISAVSAPPAAAAAAAELRLADNPLACDCRMFPLAAALRADPAAPRLRGAACAAPPALAGTALGDLDPTALTCEVADCPAACACTLHPAAHRLELSCAAPPAVAPGAPPATDVVLRLTAPPPVELRLPPAVALLDLTGLGLTEPPRLVAPPPRLDLDLRNNSLRRPPLDALSAGYGVLLAGNALVCDCGARADLLRLESHRELVRDYERVHCAGGGALAGVRLARLCAARDAAAISGSVALAALVLVLLLLWAARRHRPALRRLLVKLGLAADRTPPAAEYDAAVSYGPADAEWVWALVARLERAGLRLCVPERDWPPGAVITEQVARSAARARLTLAVVSRSLVDAPWARLELAAAAAHGGALLLVREPEALKLPALRPHLHAARRLRADDPRLAERLERMLRRPGSALGRVRLRPADLTAPADGGKRPELVLQVSELAATPEAWPGDAQAGDMKLLFDPQKPAPAAAL